MELYALIIIMHYLILLGCRFIKIYVIIYSISMPKIGQIVYYFVLLSLLYCII